MVAISVAQQPVVCERRIIVLADVATAGSKQPYHAAESMPLARAKDFLSQCVESTCRFAVEGLTAVVRSLHEGGYEVVACGMVTASARMPDSVEAILASHAAIHAAEGELYRAAIAHACKVCELPLTGLPQKDAIAAASAMLGTPPRELTMRLNAMGKAIGPPWTQDQKLAALAGLVALANVPGAVRRKAAVSRT